MEVFTDIVQGSPEWFAIRAGLPTASRFADVMAKNGPRGGIPKGRTTYMHKLAGEILTGQPMDSFNNHHMERGHEQEPDARNLYALLNEIEPEQIGFIKNGKCGCSPDSFVGDAGLLEIKTALPHIQIERLLAGRLPPEHKAQVQGQMKVAQRQWCDFMSYCPGLPPLIVRVVRDEPYIAEITVSVDMFVDELTELVEQIRRM